MKRWLKQRKHVAMLTVLVTIGSGCLGAVQTTTKQLEKDALSPITVPIEQGLKAKNTIEGVNARQEERNAQIEEIH